jgi:hypothetical protein
MSSIFFKIKQRIWREQWNIAIAKMDRKSVLNEGVDEDQIQWLFAERKNGFYADPFLIENRNKAWLLFEEYDYPSDKGVISISNITFDGKGYHATKPEIIIEEDFHLSYPRIFQKEGKWIMIPETSASGHQYFYEAIDFPIKWGNRKLLVDNIQILDPTVFTIEGKKWMFCSHLLKGENSKLYGFYYDEKTRQWKEHNGNPIVVGLECSRPAGGIFKIDEKFYRPAQNSDGTYGKSIVINEILKLSTDIYEERKVSEIKATNFAKYSKGIHTLNFEGPFVVIDGKRFFGFKKLIDPLYSRFFKKQ